MEVITTIKRSSDGLTRDVKIDFLGDTEDEVLGLAEYMFSEGNYSGDCNLHLFFIQSDKDWKFENTECGTTRYSVMGHRLG